MTDTPNIVFYHYSYSPYARRIQWYLLLRGLPYNECIQPATMPRPDIARLGVRHRRIPIVAIGRDVYLDTRLIMRKLELIQPSSPAVRPPLGFGLNPSDKKASAEALALERLLNVLTNDSGLFLEAARLIPGDVPAMKDPVFGKDRMDFFGGPLNPRPKKPVSAPSGASSPTASEEPTASKALERAEALAEVRHAASILETTLLADGRTWILSTEGPSIADIEAIWPFHWLASMPGAFLDGSGSEEAGLDAVQFPKLFAWIDRFSRVVRAARKDQPGLSKRIDGDKAAQEVLTAQFWDPLSNVSSYIDTKDPVARAASLVIGKHVVLWPTDTGKSHKDVGKLVRFCPDEVVIEVAASEDAPKVMLHAPRHGFRVRPVDGAEGPRL
ncbi:hypothetical protein SPBR_05967 [Sporothrix brasiliensis 5110]|uniref:GST N-terminal domain-containing protein n=1 Tax=Sporothrix brasiliensis 5110 TaxID=1398154 RepID=A0A0C2J5A4_9PEZI|nr:uncharacterized protein SPBR_05967 [Sporothrix brasiliensis 5110]KIH94150.1 hypothetical protein SPBR_05967 [Sporothrix brasiliensis 5110]